MHMENIEEIDKYIRGEMSAEEKKEFEARLQADKRLQQDLQRHREVLESLGDEGVVDLIKKLEEIQKRYKDGNKGISRGNKILLIAASVTLFLAVGVITLVNVINSNYTRGDSEIAVSDLKGKIYELPGSYSRLQEFVIRGTTFKMIRPPDSLILPEGQEIAFLWKYEGSNELNVVIKNYRDEIVYAASSDRADWHILSEGLDRGIYYYTISENKDLLQLGIFFVAEEK